MSPKVLMSLTLVTSLAGCASVEKADWESKAAKEFDSQKQGVCCFVGMKTLEDGSQPKSNPALIASERERAKAATQL